MTFAVNNSTINSCEVLDKGGTLRINLNDTRRETTSIIRACLEGTSNDLMKIRQSGTNKLIDAYNINPDCIQKILNNLKANGLLTEPVSESIHKYVLAQLNS